MISIFELFDFTLFNFDPLFWFKLNEQVIVKKYYPKIKTKNISSFIGKKLLTLGNLTFELKLLYW
jgi:hypothetical protein